MKKKNTQRLMPDDDTLTHICTRANYLSYCQRNYQLSCHPAPIGNGWQIIEGKCRPVRNLLPALPVYLVRESELEREREEEHQKERSAESGEGDISSGCSEPESGDTTDSEAED